MKLELAHDLLAREVFSRFTEEEKALRKADRILKDALQFHEDLKKNKDESDRWLTKAEILYISTYYDRLQTNPWERQYYENSQLFIREVEEAEKKALEAKLRQQRIIIGISVVALIFILILFIVAINLGQDYRDMADKADEKTEIAENALADLQKHIAARDSAYYREHVAEANSLFNQRLFKEARTEFQIALDYDSLGQEAIEGLRICEEKIGVKDRFDQLIAGGNSLMKQKRNVDAIMLALKKFRKAKSLGMQNDQAQIKILEATQELDEYFFDYLTRGDRLKDAGAYSLAIKKYRLALNIKPGNAEVLAKIKACEE